MLQIDDLTFNAWGRRFFDRASVSFPPNAKVGLAGRNGVGKSTLFKLILGELQPDGGSIELPRTARIGAVAQEHPATPVSLLDTILEADVERSALYAELETAEPERMGDIWGRHGFGIWAIYEASRFAGITGLQHRTDGRGVALRFALWPEAQGARPRAGGSLCRAAIRP